MSSIRRLLVGNLDCELRWAGHERLGRDVTEMISAAATAMRAFAGEGDHLWTPVPVDAGRIAPVDGLPGVEPISGPLPESDAVLPWGETAETEAARATELAGDGPWWNQLWGLHPSAAVAAACNDKRLALALSQELGTALPGARLLANIDELEEALGEGAAAASVDGSWVLKAPMSASGRLRLRRRGSELDAPARKRAERLFRRWGELVFEPWVERTGDFGQCGVLSESGVSLLPPHRLDCDRAGVFRAALIDDHDGLDQSIRAPLAAAATRVADELHQRGYRGAFGIDGFCYRDAGGAGGIQPLSEINARLSFGIIARVLKERLGLERVRLCLGRGRIPEANGVVPLLHPGSEGTVMWLEAAP
jgi:hypothetical protein